jgi:hypothetical protein
MFSGSVLKILYVMLKKVKYNLLALNLSKRLGTIVFNH